MFPPLSPNVEAALHACGRERSFFRTGTPTPGMALRFDGVKVEPPADSKPVVIGEGETYDRAAENAIAMFVGRLRDAAKNLNGWADRIEAALKGAK